MKELLKSLGLGKRLVAIVLLQSLRTKKLLIIVLLLAFHSNLYSQKKELWIVSSSGNIFLKKDSSQLIRYTKIISTDTIVIGLGAQLDLLKVEEDSYYSCSINLPGHYDMNELFGNCLNNKKSLGYKHWKYVYENVFLKETESIIGVPGGVYRSPQTDLMMFPFNNSIILDDKIDFIWKISDSFEKYFLTILDINSESKLTFEISDTCLTIHEINSIFERGNSYKWLIHSTKQDAELTPSLGFTFIIPDRSWIIDFNEKKANFEHGLNFEPCNNELLNGVFYEKNGVLIKAMKSYQQAITLSSNKEYYEMVFSSFLESY